jgi:hypothetical protein
MELAPPTFSGISRVPDVTTPLKSKRGFWITWRVKRLPEISYYFLLFCDCFSAIPGYDEVRLRQILRSLFGPVCE